MKIPNRFKLLGQVITVEYNPSLLTETDWQGLASYRRNKIELMPDTVSNKRSSDQIEHTFCHELVHHILYYAGHALQEKESDKIFRDEGFVDVMGGLLHQALSTMEYDDER